MAGNNPQGQVQFSQQTACGELDWLENVAGSDFVHMYSAIVS
jgi:hypothetical protein